jgi:hypothetical protein
MAFRGWNIAVVVFAAVAGFLLFGCSADPREDAGVQSRGKHSDTPRSEEGVQTMESASAPARRAEGSGLQERVRIEAIAFEPSVPVTGDRLRATVELDNPDGADVRLIHRWKVNGETVSEAESDTLEHPLRFGDFVELEVVPVTAAGEGRRLSESISVANAPPFMKLTGQEVDGASTYTAGLEVEDPEGDAVVLELREGPEGMRLDPSMGRLIWPIPENVEGSFDVAVSGRDTHGGESLLRFQVKVSRMPNSAGRKP